MPTTTRIQRRYDHRLRDLVQTTGDPELAIRHGVPRSTARGWRTKTTTEVVSLDVLELDTIRLQHEVILLRRRIARLLSLLRLVIIALKVSGISFARVRLPEGTAKLQLLRAIERSRSHLPLRSVLRKIGVSHGRYYAWVRDDSCLDDRSFDKDCRVRQLTLNAVITIRRMVTSDRIPACLTESWWRVLKHQWLYLNTLDTVATVRKLVAFYIDQHNTHLPHSAFRGQTPDEMYFGTGSKIPKKLEASRIAARHSRMEANRAQTCQACEETVSIIG